MKGVIQCRETTETALTNFKNLCWESSIVFWIPNAHKTEHEFRAKEFHTDKSTMTVYNIFMNTVPK